MKNTRLILFVFIILNLTNQHALGVQVADNAEYLVSGIVSDQNDEEVLIGVSIIVKGDNVGTTTDLDGFYELSVPSRNDTLIFSFIGYETQIIPIQGRDRIDIGLVQSTSLMDELVVTGYGETSRRRLTTSISTKKLDESAKLAINTPAEGLKGKVPGVRIYNMSGQPGEEPQIRIRGGSSIQKSNDPLILIDGLEGAFSDVHPADIESVEVLKDAAATSIYGSRGSNGVVLVTTKGGSFNMAPQITIETNYTHQSVERYYERLNSEQFINLARPAAAMSPNPNWAYDEGRHVSANHDDDSFVGLRYLEPGESPPAGWKTMPDPLDPSRMLTFVDNDMTDIAFNSALRSYVNIGAAGGTQNIKYAGSIGYTDDEGVVYSTGWSQFNVRANTGIIITDKLNLSTNLNYIETTPQEHPDQLSAISRQVWAPPTQRVYMSDGSPARGYARNSGNPEFWGQYNLSEQKVRRTRIGAELDYEIIDNLYAKISGDYYLRSHRSETFQKANVFNSLRPSTYQNNEERNAQVTGTLTYNFKAGARNNFSALIGAEYFDADYLSVSAEAQGSSTDKVTTLNISPEKTEARTFKSAEVITGLFSRLTYDYDGKYLISASIRQDGSSRFGAEERYSLFPSFSAGWVVSDEPFFNNSRILSFLKLRASVGQTGNNDIGLYTSQGSYALDYVYNGNAGIRNTIMPNRNLTWETTTQYDFGTDIGLFDDKVNVTVDLYDKRTKDLLFSVPLPNTSGFSSVESNVGEVRFYGFDFEVTANVVSNDNFSWTSSFNISGMKNEVLKLPENGRENNRIGGWVVSGGEDFGGIAEGEPLYRIWGHKVDYIIDNEQQAANALYDDYANGWDYETQTYTKGRKFPGDYEWVDRDGDGQITARDQFELGRSVPHTVGGLSNALRYKNFTVNIHLDFALGHTMLDQNFGFSMQSATQNSIPVQILDAWQEPGDAANTEWAKFSYHSSWENWNYRRPSSAWQFDLDYLAIRELTVDYKLPNSLVQRWGVNDINVYISGNNLHYFSEVLASTPEASNNAYSSNVGYPPVRKITLGLRAKF